jgi:hypothetical protein
MLEASLYAAPQRTPAGSETVSAVQPALHRRIETLCIVVFWLLVVEGALRKWVLPQYSHLLFFIRDPFVILIYWYGLQAKAFGQGGALLKIGLAFAILAIPLAFMQIAAVGDSQLVLIVVYGWRQYFLYLPLPFVMAATLNRDSLARFLRHVMVAVAISAPLVFLQFHSPSGAVINRGISDDERLQFQSFAYTEGLIRPSGTFTTTVGITELVSSSLALLLATWLTPAASRKTSSAVLVIAAAATGMCLALSGSRAAFVHSTLVVSSALLVGVVTRQASVRSRAVLVPSLLVVAVVVLYPILFPDALQAILNRATEAGGNTPIWAVVGRALYETIDFVGFAGRAPLIGYGLGLGGNGRGALNTTDTTLLSESYAESDWSRHIVDLGPLIGFLFILYRIAFTFEIFARCIRATRASGSPYPLLLFGYVGIGLFYGQLTGQGTAGGFIWLFLGLCMASCNAPPEKSGSATAVIRVEPRWKIMT